MSRPPIPDSALYDSLSQEQRAVVAHKGGHALVSAVAGSGKTLTLIRRILFLLRAGAKPEKILVVMFNRDAKDAFSARLKAECAPLGLSQPEIFTFHKLGKRICDNMMRHGLLPKAEFRGQDGLPLAFLRQALERAAKEREVDSSALSDPSQIAELFALIEVWKGDLLRPIEIRSSVDHKDIDPVYKDAYLHYEEMRLERGFRAFADLLYDPVTEMRRQDLRVWAGNRYSHILVDEYQDVNIAQQEMIQFLAGTTAQVMVVGDEDQCIYEWRGSRPDYMTGLFEQFFTGAKTYTLSHTYRFGHTVALAANALMYQNKNRTKKLCVSSVGTPATAAELYEASEDGEGGLLAGLIKDWVESGRRLGEVAILVRSWAMAVGPEMELVAAGIPHLMGDRDKSYRSRPEMQALSGLLALGMPDGLAWLAGGGRGVLPRMIRYSGIFLKKEHLGELTSLLSAGGSLPDILREYSTSGDLRPKAQALLETVADQWQSLQGTLSPEMPAERALTAVECLLGFREQIGKNHVNAQHARDAEMAIDSLRFHAQTNNMTLASLFEHLTESAGDGDGAGDRVLITSVHKAKGLEWPMVILPQLREGRFPHFEGEAPGGDEGMEQERRLFYVAMTRAVERLVMVVPPDERLAPWQEKGFFGAPKKGYMKASRFVYEAGVARAIRIGKQLYSGVVPANIVVGEQDYLYQAYLRKLYNH